MEHKLFKILSLIALGLVTLSGSLYIYYSVTNEKLYVLVILKALPAFILLLLDAFYMIHYKTTIFSTLLGFFLIFCLAGDVFLALYEKHKFYLILGGGSFLAGRLLLTANFIIFPHDLEIIKFPPIRHFVVIFTSVSFFLVLGVINLLYNYGLIGILMLVYSGLGMGLPLGYSILRIGSTEESPLSTILSFVGVSLFNISDILLIVGIEFPKRFAPYFILYTDIIYWIAIYLITISVIRTNNEDVEREGFYQLPTFYVPRDYEIVA